MSSLHYVNDWIQSSIMSSIGSELLDLGSDLPELNTPITPTPQHLQYSHHQLDDQQQSHTTMKTMTRKRKHRMDSEETEDSTMTIGSHHGTVKTNDKIKIKNKLYSLEKELEDWTNYRSHRIKEKQWYCNQIASLSRQICYHTCSLPIERKSISDEVKHLLHGLNSIITNNTTTLSNDTAQSV